MKYLQEIGTITNKTEIAQGIYDVILYCPKIADIALPGQFINILCSCYTLRRPISICGIDKEDGCIRIVFEIRGQGTEWLASLDIGDKMDITGPLGHGFTIDKNKRTILIGGGIGVPPLLSIAKHTGKNTTALLGFRSKENEILIRDFIGYGSKVMVATDDGSDGYHGFVTALLERLLFEQLLNENQPKYDIIQACGPRPMLKITACIAEKYNIKCEVSLEERMACGIGACLVCACKTKDKSGEEHYSHVCKNGPVFDAKEVVW